MPEQSQRLTSHTAKFTDPKAAMGSLAIAICLALYFFAASFDSARINATSPLIWQLGLTSAVAAVAAAAMIAARHYIPLSRVDRNVLIVGTSVGARKLAETIRQHPGRGYRIAGFADDEWEGTNEARAQGDEVVSDLDDLGEYLRNNVIDEVVLALPSASRAEQTERVLLHCEAQGITVRLPLNFLSLKMGQSQLTEGFFGVPVVTLQAETITGAAATAKRLLDITVSSTMLVALAPLLLITAATVKLTSPGPVFFVQKRVGLGKRLFPLFKFRTMVVDAEAQLANLETLNEAGGPTFKIAQDPRITRIGTFLRKTSIDELPQLVNILRGEMSLVGPRPLPIRDVNGFKKDEHRRRFTVPPGLTCLWQIGGRSNVTFDQWMELDSQYIDEWTPWLDLKILARTVPVVLKGTGAT